MEPYFKDYRTKWIIIAAIIIAIGCLGYWKINKDAEHERAMERYKRLLDERLNRNAAHWRAGEFGVHTYEDQELDRKIEGAEKDASK